MTQTVVIIAPDLQRGGSVGSVALRHATELSLQYNVHVITRNVPPDLPEAIKVVIVSHRRWSWLRRFCHVPNELAFQWAARRALVALAKRTKVDIVWSHSHTTAALVTVPLKRRLKFHDVMTTHGDIFDRPPGTYSRELTWLYKTVTPKAYRGVDAVHVLSPYMAGLAERGGALPDHVWIVPNGVDPLDVGSPAPAPRSIDSFMPAGRLRLLYVGDLLRNKGVDVLVCALATLRQWHRTDALGGGADATLAIIGAGPLRAELESLIIKLGLREQVSLLGRVQRDHLVQYYAQSDLVCVPSISEAFSLVTLEAMALGVPVVGSNVGGITSLVESGVSGYLATPDDAERLADAIAEAAISREHLAQLGEAGYERAHTVFSWPAVGRQLAALVARTTESGQAASIA